MRNLLSLVPASLHAVSQPQAPVKEPDHASLPLYDIYKDTFDVVRVDTDEMREASFRLRYQVYCVERPFENPAENPGELEKDCYDERSVHSLLIHRKSGMLVGNVRVILPDPKAPLTSFPLQDISPIAELKDPTHVRWSCEVSRFCVSKNFRKRDTDTFYTGVFLRNRMNPISLFSPQHQQRVIPFTPLGLMRAVFEMALDHDIIWGYALMEPQFVRLLAKLGVNCKVLGPTVPYHGERCPVELHPLKICASVKRKHPEIWKVLTNNGQIVARMEALMAKQQAAPH